MEIVCAVFALIGVLFSITTHVTYKNRENRLKNELRSIERSFRYHRYNTEDYFSREEIYHIEEAIIEVYSMAKRRKISSSRALEIFTDAGISSDLVHRLMDRLYIGKLLDKCSVLTLSDFMSELLPELFLQRRTYRSSSMDIRYLEDFYDKLRHSLRIDNGRGLDEINKKLDALNTYIKKSMHTNTQNSASAETYGRQNQIRELFHALETPIATTEMAIVTLKASFETLTDTQKAKFDRIQDSIRLIKSILFAYRELSSMNIFSDQNTFFSLPEIIESFPEIMSVNDAKIEQYSIPDQIPEYSGLIKSSIAPYFQEANITLAALSTKDIQDFYLDQLNRVSANTVIHYHAIIHRALKYAVKMKLIAVNPANDVERPKKDKFIGNFYDSAEISALFQHIGGHSLELPIKLAAFYGLRRSEILGLKWDAIDFNTNTISIRHTVTACNLEGKHIEVVANTTKNKSSTRTLPLVPAFQELLLQKKEEQSLCRKLCGNAYCKDYLGYICVNELGERLKPNTLSAGFKRILEENGLRIIRFHDLRHSCASLLLANGVSLKHIQEWLGHSDFSTTANFYAHLDFHSKLSSAEAMQTGLGMSAP